MNNITSLLMSSRFFAMILSGSLAVITGNILRQSILLLVTYRLLADSNQAFLWGSILGALYFIPSFLFSTLAGELADKIPKAQFFRITRGWQVAICLLMASTLLQEIPNIYILAASLFLMATHDAFFSPVRYALLPEYLSKEKLVLGNGILEATTLISIALGIGFANLIDYPGGNIIIALLILTFSISAYMFSLWIPTKKVFDRTPIQIKLNIFSAIQSNIDNARQNPHIWQSILGITWFWFIGYSLMLQFSNYVKYNLYCNAEVAMAFNISYTLGLAFGSLICHNLVKNKLNGRFTPLSLFTIAIFGIHLWFGSRTFGHSTDQLMGMGEFITTLSGWRLLTDVFFLAAAGGVLIVPLYSIIQRLSKRNHCSRNIASLNIIASIGMGAAAILQTIFISSLNMPFIHYIGLLFLASGILGFYTLKNIPFNQAKLTIARILTWLLRIEIEGAEHIIKANRKLLIIANHVSYLEVPLLAILLPRHMMFAVNTEIAKWWIVRLVTPFTNTFPIDPMNPYGVKALINKVNEGRTCIIFPEGALSRTGKIMKIYEGTGLIAEKTGADIIAINIKGVESSILAPHRHNYCTTHYFPKVKISISKPFNLPKTNLHGKEKRAFLSQEVYQKLIFQSYQNKSKGHLIEEIYQAKSRFGSNKIILEDITGSSLSYQQLVTKMHVLALALKNKVPEKNHLGILLPNTNANVVTFFACQVQGVIPAMLNFTAGKNNIASAIKTAQINTVITSKAFIEKANLAEIIAHISPLVKMIYLEDVAQKISLTQKIKGALMGLTWPLVKGKPLCPNAPALILFTSGSEGTPKGVVLSHLNIMANIRQVLETVDIGPKDRMFNPLPMFHAFGINVGTLTPIFGGIFTFLYPNPKHFSQIPNVIYEKNITVMMGTNTFLAAYHKCAHPYDFNTVRLAVTGGEKLADETKRIYAEDFGIRILEGYGSTECSPVISCNTPLYQQTGSVGLTLPGIETKLTPFPNRKNAFELAVKGDNVMMGYLLASDPGMLQPPENGWYHTGDVIEQDPQGYVHIVDRVKRFAKIGGEMISLSQVENVIQSCWPNFQHGLVTMRDDKKGEKIILVTTNPNAQRADLIHAINQSGLNNLSLPAVIESISEIPLLGSGKIDYVRLKSLAQSLFEQNQMADVT
jgi:acyl-[acyl-carrier-protein]-phospholipid O-acyltransferase/long-chain-fatty-acid--[acyl-carrier-protein] ligase